MKYFKKKVGKGICYFEEKPEGWVFQQAFNCEVINLDDMVEIDLEEYKHWLSVLNCGHRCEEVIGYHHEDKRGWFINQPLLTFHIPEA